MAQTSDGGYIAAGTSDQKFIHLLKTDMNGIITWTNEISIKPGNKLDIYPNPSKNITTLSFELGQIESITLSIRNICGQELKQIPYGIKKTGNYELNCDDFSPGIYFITLKTNSGILTEKLIIE